MIGKLAPGCSYGKVLKSAERAGFIMTEVAYSAESSLSEHAHENAHFCFVLQGSYTETYRREEMRCVPRTLTFRPPGEIHQDKFHDRDVRVFTLEIPPYWIERLRQDSVDLGRSINFQGGFVTRLSERLVSEFHQMDTAAGLIIEGLALEIMAETARRFAGGESVVPGWLKRAKDLLHAHFSENLTLEQIAAEVGVHPVHLASTFRQKYNCTVGEYIRWLRVEYACREIAAGETPLVTIALNAGFANQAHFTSTFKRLTGFTPAAYRKFLRGA